MNIIFAGTPEFTLPVLHAVVSSPHQVITILTRPDKPAGRGLKQHQSAVKQEALRLGLTVEQPEQFTPQVIESIAALQADLMITMGYGVLLPDELLASLPLGCINIHTSLLPRWRGAAPVARAIEAGDTTSGISLMLTVSELDAGPIISQHPCPIAADDTTRSLEKKLSELGDEQISRLLDYAPDEMRARIEQAQEQPAAGVTYAKKLTKQEAWIDWNDSAHNIARKIQAYNPWPVAQTLLQEKTFRIWAARVCDDDIETAQLRSTKHQVFVGCGEGAVELLEVQLAGGKAMAAAAFANGHRITNTLLGTHNENTA